VWVVEVFELNQGEAGEMIQTAKRWTSLFTLKRGCEDKGGDARQGCDSKAPTPLVKRNTVLFPMNKLGYDDRDFGRARGGKS